MKNFTLGLVFVFGGALLATAACGDEDNDGGSSDGGTSSTSKGGSTSGGNTAKGGSSSGGSSSGKGGMTGGGGEDNGSAGENNGSAGEDNGFGGFPGFGGAFNNPESCPDDPPMSDSNCTVEPDAQNGCVYPNSYCICAQYGEFAAIGSWICIAGGNNECPPEPPIDGQPCEGPILGDCDGCYCPGGQGSTWLCP